MHNTENINSQVINEEELQLPLITEPANNVDNLNLLNEKKKTRSTKVLLREVNQSPNRILSIENKPSSLMNQNCNKSNSVSILENLNEVKDHSKPSNENLLQVQDPIKEEYNLQDLNDTNGSINFNSNSLNLLNRKPKNLVLNMNSYELDTFNKFKKIKTFEEGRVLARAELKQRSPDRTKYILDFFNKQLKTK